VVRKGVNVPNYAMQQTASRPVCARCLAIADRNRIAQ